MIKIYVFVKILSQWRRKEGGRILILRSASASSLHLKITNLKFSSFCFPTTNLKVFLTPRSVLFSHQHVESNGETS